MRDPWRGPGGLPPSVALALEPAVERTISLELGDIFDRIPQDCLKEGEKPDLGRRVLLKASAVEKGMATGKPSITLALVYEQFPELFAKEIAPSDPAEIALPYEKVVEQFTTARVREDQQHATSVPQVETPILQIALEDTGSLRDQDGARGSWRASVYVHQGATRDCESDCRRATGERRYTGRQQPAPEIDNSVNDANRSTCFDSCAGCFRQRLRVPIRLKSLLVFHRTERVRPPLREFQPQVGRPFQLHLRPKRPPRDLHSRLHRHRTI